MFQDALGIGACILIGQYIDLIPLLTIRYLCWLILFITQGALMTGLWVVAHECGHQAFSPSLIVNDTGIFYLFCFVCICFSFLLKQIQIQKQNSWKYTSYNVIGAILELEIYAWATSQ